MPVRAAASPIDIAISGLRAQSMRLNVIASNIANAETTRTATGQPYRRKDLVLSTDPSALAGVKVDQIAEDMTTDFRRIYQPGNPLANAEGYVSMPNVDIPTEMIHLVTASRAYQANAMFLKRQQELGDVTLELLR